MIGASQSRIAGVTADGDLPVMVLPAACRDFIAKERMVES
jgi:hypothetical protein